jgi:YHS domain-containing protein
MSSITPFARILMLTLAVGCAPLAVTSPASAKQPAFYTTTKEKLALSGYDPVAYFVAGKPVKGSGTIADSYEGATWYFASEANRATFQTDPAKYAPQYGGYCAWAVSQGYTASADPQAWKIVDGKLYVNYNHAVAADWAKNIPTNIKNANANWPKVLEK